MRRDPPTRRTRRGDRCSCSVQCADQVFARASPGSAKRLGLGGEYVFDERRGPSCLADHPSHSVADAEPTGMNLTTMSGKEREFPAGVKHALLLEVLQQYSSERQIRIEFVFVVLTVLFAGEFEQVTRDTDPGEKVKH